MSDVFTKAFDDAAADHTTVPDVFASAFDAPKPRETATMPGGKLHPALQTVATRLGIDPDHLARIINYESGGRPDAVNPQSGATGLIQFLPSTAQGLGTTAAALKGMSIEEQAPYVEKYLRQNGATGKGFADLYASVLMPAEVGKPFDSPLFAKGTKAYSQNAQLDINHDGVVTKAEAAQSAYGGPIPEVQDYEARLGMRRGEILASQDQRKQEITDLHARARVLEMEIGRKEGMGQHAADGRRQLGQIYSQLRSLQGIPEPEAPAYQPGHDDDLAGDPMVAGQQARTAMNQAKTPEQRKALGGVAQMATGAMQQQDAQATSYVRAHAIEPVLNLGHTARLEYQKSLVKLFTGKDATEEEINQSPAMRIYNHVADAGDYFVPIAGQAKALTEMGLTGADVLSSGDTLDAAKQVWRRGLDPTAPGLEWEERGIRAAFLALMAVHGAGELKMDLDSHAMAGQLVKEYGMDQAKAAETVRMARDAVNGGYGDSVAERVKAFQDQLSRTEVGKVAGAMARGSEHAGQPSVFELAFDRPGLAQEGRAAIPASEPDVPMAAAFAPENSLMASLPVEKPVPVETSAQVPAEPSKAPEQRSAAKVAWSALKGAIGDGPVSDKEYTMMRTREMHGTVAYRSQQLVEKFKEASEAMDRRGPESNLDFLDRIENGKSQTTPEDQQLAKALSEVYEPLKKQIDSLDGEREWLDNYAAHLWKDPEAAKSWVSQVLGRRPLKSSPFLKRRTIPTIKEGVEAGLVPVTTNPVELTLLKAHQMIRYIEAKKFIGDLKDRGLLTFGRVGTDPREMAEQGLARIEGDSAFTVYGPSHVEVPEHFDASVRHGLEDLADRLGIAVHRGVSASRFATDRSFADALGLSDGKGNIFHKFFTDDGVRVHEIAHELDARYAVGEKLKSKLGSTYDNETAELANYRLQGVDASPKMEEYVQLPEERFANLVHALLHAPELAERVAPETTDALRQFLKDTPELRSMLDIKPGVDIGKEMVQVPVAGSRVMGHYYAPVDAARVLNNWLGPRLSSWTGDPESGLKSTIGYGYKGIMAVNNNLNRAQLGVSWFHFFTTMSNAAATDAAIGLRMLTGIRRGRSGFATQGLQRLVTGHVPFYSLVDDFLKGGRIQDAGIKGEMKSLNGPAREEMVKIVGGVIKSGGRFGVDELLKSNAFGDFKKALREQAYGKAAKRFIPAVVNSVTIPLMDTIIPRVKLGAFGKMFLHELDLLGPDATHEEIQRAATSVWNSVDDRFGLLVQDNLFFNRYAVDVSMALTRAVGWNLGSIRAIAGGAYDLPADFLSGRLQKTGVSNRTAFVAGMYTTSALIGGVMHYLLTGQRPDGPKDLLHPRTGLKNADGTDERLNLPGYVKDSEAYKHDPAATMLHKVSPVLSLAQELIQGTDYYGTRIRNDDDPLVRRLLDDAEHIAKAFIPFTVQSEIQHHDQTGHYDLLSTVGITPAASWITHTPAYLKAVAYAERDRPRGSRTAEEAQLGTDKKSVMRLYANGQVNEAMEQFNKLQLTPEQRQSVLKDMRRLDQGEPAVVRVAEHLRGKELLEVWDEGNPEEREALAPLVVQHLRREAALGRMGSMGPEAVDRAFTERPELMKFAAGPTGASP